MIGFVVFGLAVGVVTRLLKLGRQKLSLFVALLVAVAGSVIGGTLTNFIAARDILGLSVVGSIVAVASAIGLLALAEGMAASPNSGHPSVGPRDTPGSGEGVSAARLADVRREWP